MIREYTWRDWMSIPQNRELYNRNMKEGLRQFRLEKQRRDDQVRYAEFLMEQRRIQQINEAVSTAAAASSAGGAGGGGGLPPSSGTVTDAVVTSFLAKTLISDSTIESSLDTFVKTLKAESLWDDMLLFYPMVTDKSTSSEIFEQFKFNLVNANSNKLTEFDGKFSAVTVDTNGISDFGDVNTLKTGFRPSSATTQFDDGEAQVPIISGGYYLRTLTDTNFTIISDETGISNNNMIRVTGEGSPSQLNLRWPNSSTSNIATTAGGDIGTLILSGEQYNDGESESYRVFLISSSGYALTVDGVTPTNSDSPLTLGSVESSADDVVCGNQISAYFIMNAGLSQAQMTTVRDAVNQLQTDLGRATHS